MYRYMPEKCKTKFCKNNNFVDFVAVVFCRVLVNFVSFCSLATNDDIF